MGAQDRDDLDRAHRAVKELAKSLEAEGVGADSIVDALLVVGANAAIRMGAPDVLVKFFRDTEKAIEAGTPVSSVRH